MEKMSHLRPKTKIDVSNEEKLYPLSWRSEKFEKLLESLDRKYLRRITEKARTMLKEKRRGESMVCDAPDDIPDWMIKH